MKTIIVASKNPAKIKAVEDGFQRLFPETNFSVQGVSAESDVSHQPFSEKETFQGASNRAKNAKEANPDADFWCGLEGGIEDHDLGMNVFGYVVILSKEKMGYGDTGHFQLPPEVAELVRSGKELSEADDIVFKRKDSARHDGAIGLLTNSVITRAQMFEQGVVFALIPFVNEYLY